MHLDSEVARVRLWEGPIPVAARASRALGQNIRGFAHKSPTTAGCDNMATMQLAGHSTAMKQAIAHTSTVRQG